MSELSSLPSAAANEDGEGSKVPFEDYLQLPLGELAPVAACVNFKKVFAPIMHIPNRKIAATLPNALHRHFFSKKPKEVTSQLMDIDRAESSEEEEEDEEEDEEGDG